MLRKFWKGFSWIEIASVTLLFVVVVALTLPSYSRFECVAKQSEAKFELMRILAAAQLFKSEYERYPNMDELLLQERVKLRQKHYTYEITSRDQSADLLITAQGKAKSQVAKDRWRVDERKRLENLQDACQNLN